MGEAVNQSAAILLPTATVAVYSRDQETLQAARDAMSDWRFARVEIIIYDGGVETAIESYRKARSHDVVIVQTDTTDEAFAKQLEELGAQCSEGTAAIVIGPVNDVYLYRRMIDMGISDYLVRPVKKEILADVMAKTLIERLGVGGSRLIAFIGAKGGVGTTALAHGAAWGVSEMLGQKTMLLDSAGGWSTASVGLGFEPSATLAETARAAANNDEDSIKRMLFRASDKLSVLASGSDAMLETPLEPDQFEQLLNMLMATYPVVIVDLSHGAENLANTVISKASQVIVVSSPTLPSLRLARSLVQEIREHRGGSDAGIEMIVNMQGIAGKSEIAKKDAEQAMEFKISSMIVFDPSLFYGLESQGKKITSDPRGADIVRKVILPLVQKVVTGSLDGGAPEVKEKSGLLGGLLGKGKSKG